MQGHLRYPINRPLEFPLSFISPADVLPRECGRQTCNLYILLHCSCEGRGVLEDNVEFGVPEKERELSRRVQNLQRSELIKHVAFVQVLQKSAHRDAQILHISQVCIRTQGGTLDSGGFRP
jgi:hypothetical protein